MKKIDYFKQAIKAKMYLERDWIRFLIATPVGVNNFLYVNEGKYIGYIGDEPHTIDDADTTEPLFKVSDKIKADTGLLSIIKKDTDTTVGRILLNAMMIEFGCNGRLEYINEQFSFMSHVYPQIKPHLVDGDKPGKGDVWTIYDYLKASNTVAFYRGLGAVTIVADTEETFYPPEGLQTYKKQKQAEYAKKYGSDWVSNPTYVTMYEDELMAWLKNALKDNPRYGITMTRKAWISIKERYVSIGIQPKISPDADSVPILTSLSEGIPLNKRAIATDNNATRYGSASRGLETKVSGLEAKKYVRAGQGFKIIKEDCGTKDGADILMSKPSVDGLLSLQVKLKHSDKWEYRTKEWLESQIGNKVIVRLPVYCKEKGERRCKSCMGKDVSRTENGITNLLIGMGGELLYASLAKFHATINSIYKLNLKDIKLNMKK